MFAPLKRGPIALVFVCASPNPLAYYCVALNEDQLDKPLSRNRILGEEIICRYPLHQMKVSVHQFNVMGGIQIIPSIPGYWSPITTRKLLISSILLIVGVLQ